MNSVYHRDNNHQNRSPKGSNKTEYDYSTMDTSGKIILTLSGVKLSNALVPIQSNACLPSIPNPHLSAVTPACNFHRPPLQHNATVATLPRLRNSDPHYTEAAPARWRDGRAERLYEARWSRLRQWR